MAHAVQVQAGKKLWTLEIGRFAAALMVMLAHVIPYVNDFTAPGVPPAFDGLSTPAPLGVQYFFVLSGFVMANTHHRDFGKLKSVPMFWWRRACRIYPVYWLALCVPAYYLFGAITFPKALHLISLDPWFDQDIVPVAWTLRFEMAFYIMFGLGLLPYIGKPLLAFWISFTIWRWSGTLMGLFHPQALMSLYWFTQLHAGKFTSFMSFYFFGGMAAGFIFARVNIGRGFSLALMAVSLIALLFMLPAEQWGATYTLNPMFILAMGGVIGATILGLALLERHHILRLGPKAGWAAAAGAVSYPLYLLHGPILMLIYNLIPLGKYQTPSLYLGFILLTGTVLAASVLVARFYDQPIQRALRRLGKKTGRLGDPLIPGSRAR